MLTYIVTTAIASVILLGFLSRGESRIHALLRAILATMFSATALLAGGLFMAHEGWDTSKTLPSVSGIGIFIVVIAQFFVSIGPKATGLIAFGAGVFGARVTRLFWNQYIAGNFESPDRFAERQTELKELTEAVEADHAWLSAFPRTYATRAEADEAAKRYNERHLELTRRIARLKELSPT